MRYEFILVDRFQPETVVIRTMYVVNMLLRYKDFGYVYK
jgi:hypothetical protein